MELVHPESLALTLDAVNHALFTGAKLSKAARLAAARFIAGRQGLPRSYANMFAPTELDYRAGIRMFTGEKISSGAATGHILGEEACRTLRLLDVPDKAVRQALAEADAGILNRLKENQAGAPGTYCCGTCSVSLWRNLLAGGLDRREARLESGIRELKKMRDDKGRWGRYPFHYALLALVEMDFPAAIKEMKHAAPALERIVKRAPGDDVYAQRRQLLAERVLARV